MPASQTITAFNTFSRLTTIRSADVNDNFTIFRGHSLPVNTDTASSSDLTHDLGAPTHRWMNIYGGVSVMTGQSTPAANPTTGQYKVYVKSSNGYLYKLNSAGTETQILESITLPTTQIFTSGSGTYTTPANVRYIKVTMVGGGGGGGGSGTAGGSAGTSGGNSTFGTSLLTANGGAAGAWNGGGAGAAGGSATISSPAVSIVNITGASGRGSMPVVVGSYMTGADGGGTAFSSGGSGGAAAATGQAPSANSGGGGGGGGNNTGVAGSTGPGGGAGAFIVAKIDSPSATYSYAVGAAGTAQAAGTSGLAGGAGAAGIIIVEEFY